MEREEKHGLDDHEGARRNARTVKEGRMVLVVFVTHSLYFIQYQSNCVADCAAKDEDEVNQRTVCK